MASSTTSLLIFILVAAISSQARCESLNVVDETLSKNICIDECVQKDKEVFTCSTSTGWAYCLPKGYMSMDGLANGTSQNQVKYLQRFNFTLVNGSWQKDGIKLVRSRSCDVKHLTRYGQLCVSECAKRDNYYYCYYDSNGDWDYCSITSNHTVYDARCTNSCGQHGFKYYWCYTLSSWDYCGLIVQSCY